MVERRKEKRTVTADEVAKHNTRESLWMCIEDEVWECVSSCFRQSRENVC